MLHHIHRVSVREHESNKNEGLFVKNTENNKIMSLDIYDTYNIRVPLLLYDMYVYVQGKLFCLANHDES